uniref:Reverse transcriptase domain-containing protein n=1 Tax=Tanacetum cinerariifolium TaxID=118510 RepID=A0A6L2LQP9_TANCI|nr:reverse transcriptase domain-containing protein [Tanacetum cinerariifolium]
MRTRSNFYPFNSTATIPRRSNRRRVPNIVKPEIRTIEEIVLMAGRTMEELLQAPTEGDNPHNHISNFKRMTATLKYKDVLNDVIKLMLFSYSLEGAARIWYEKEPPNSILTWDDLVNKFINQFFPPSKTTHLKNEISRFTQRFEETFGEAWDRFKEMLRACPHHGFSELTQIDTFYNGLTEQDQDSLNAASGGNLLNKTTREALKIIENKSKVRYSRSKSNVFRVNMNTMDNVSKTNDRIDKLADQISNLVEIVNKQVIAPSKAVEKTCVTCGGAHAYYDCIATDSNQPSVCAPTGSYNHVSSPDRASHQIPPPSFAPVQSNPNSKQEKNLRRNLNSDMRSILGSFFQNQPSTLGTLPSNIVPNPKGEMKAVTTCSGLAYEGSSIPTNSPLEKVDEQNTEEILDKEHSNCPVSTAQVQPLVVPIFIPELDVPRTQSKPTIPYLSRLNDHKLREKATNQMEKLFQIIHDLHFDISFADALLLMPKFASTIKSLLANKDKLFELAKVPLNENCLAMLLKKLPEKLGDTADPRVPLILGRSFLRTGRALIDVYGEEITLRNLFKSSNPTLVSESDFCKEPIVKSSSPTLTPFGESDFFLEEIEDFLNDDSIPTGIDNSFMGYEHLSTTPATELDKVTESSAKNIVPIPSEYEVTSYDESEYEVLVKDDSSPVLTAFSNPLFNDNDDNELISDEEVSKEEFKVYLNPLFDDDEINSDEIDLHCLNVQSNFVESLSNHDTLINSSLKFDYLEEFFRALMPIRIADEERIRREHAEYISLMEREDIDIFTDTGELLPPDFESDGYDSEGEIYVLEELLVDNSIPSSENELSDFDHDNSLFPRPLPEPPYVKFNFEPNSGEVISVMMNNNDELIDDECFDPGGEINVFTNVKDDDYFPFIFVIQIFLPYLIYPEVSPLLLSVGSEDTIFNPGIFV